MNRTLEDFIESTAAAHSVDEVGRLLLRELETEGVGNLVFASVRGGVLQRVVWEHLPDGYSDAYFSHRWDRFDPVLRHAVSATRAFSWESVTRPETLRDEQRAFLNECAELGVHGGLTAPIHGPSGELDIVSVSMRSRTTLPSARLRQVHALAFQAWMRVDELRPSGEPPKPVLSARELECLKWLKDGKTNWEIGQILTISEKTVEFHVGNVLRKFHADSRLAAVMFALRARLLEL